jgi:predicted transposase YdaD
MSPSTDVFIELITGICTDPAVFPDADLYIDSVLYYIISEGNVKKQDEFIEKLKAIPNCEEKVMGTLAQRWLSEGKAEGLHEGMMKVAKSMLDEGSDIAFIIKVTGLSASEIEKLK